MTIPDRNAFRKKLESLGAAEVKKRVEVGAYAQNKLVVVKHWLADQVAQPAATSGYKAPTLVDKYVTKLKNHPVIAVVVVVGMAIGGVAQFTDALSKVVVIPPWSAHPAKDRPVIPGDSGWLLVGDLDPSAVSYVRGPFYKTEKSSYPTTSVVPRKGELLRLLAERNVIIAGYKTNGLARQFMPPWQLNILSDVDYTGVKLPKDSVGEVRDVSLGSFPSQPVVVWVRVAPPPK